MVDFTGVVGLIGDLLPQGYGVARLLYISVKAGSISGMAASRAVLPHFQDERILIAVGEDLLDRLGVARGRAFVPELLAAAGKIDCFSDFERLAERFLVHVGDHEDFVRVRILRDRDDETVLVELGGKGEAILDRFAIIAGSEGDFS
jgi:hypothetical protein